MTSQTDYRLFYHGYLLDEHQGELANPIEVDLALYTAGWEERCSTIAQRKQVRAGKTVVFSFSDAGTAINPAKWLRKNRRKVEELEIGSHYNIVGCISRLLDLIQANPALFVGRVFLDASCMPKFMLQWVVMELLSSKIPSELIIGYVSGKYARRDGRSPYDQGVREYVHVPHSSNAGTSTRKACIAALGADERLVSDYFENEFGFDRYFLLASQEISHTAIAEQVKRQVDSLRERHNLEDEAVGQVQPYAFLESLRVLDRFVKSAPDCDAWDIFCSGPKPHAIAACLLAMKHRSVRLIGRIPREYDQTDVTAGEIIAFLRIVDLASPRVATIKNFSRPFV
jgi:hypothetical protein